MPQLGGLDSCVAPSIILAQRVKEPLHLPFDFRCIGVHAALLPVWLRAEGLITYFGKTGKLFPAHSLAPEIRLPEEAPCSLTILLMGMSNRFTGAGIFTD